MFIIDSDGVMVALEFFARLVNVFRLLSSGFLVLLGLASSLLPAAASASSVAATSASWRSRARASGASDSPASTTDHRRARAAGFAVAG
eukprot:916025-Prorocentrum_minimum.AAC.1